MIFLLISVGFLSVAAGLPFPQEFLSPPSQTPPTVYREIAENNRGFRVQKTVPEGNKVVIQVPNEPSRIIQESFRYFPEEQRQQVIQYQDEPQRIQYAPQGIPDHIPQLYLPAQVAQAIEQIPQGIHHAGVQQDRNPAEQPSSQDNFVQQEINQSATNEQIPFTNGQQLMSEHRTGNVQSTPSDQHVKQDPQPVQNSQPDQVASTESIISQEQFIRHENYANFQQTPQREQFEQKVQQALQENFKPQKTVQQQTSEVQQVPDQQVFMVQHGPNGVHIIREGEYNGRHQQFVQPNGQQVAEIPLQRIENISPVQQGSRIVQQNDQERPNLSEGQINQQGSQAVQITRHGEYIHQQQEPQQQIQQQQVQQQQIQLQQAPQQQIQQQQVPQQQIQRQQAPQQQIQRQQAPQQHIQQQQVPQQQIQQQQVPQQQIQRQQAPQQQVQQLQVPQQQVQQLQVPQQQIQQLQVPQQQVQQLQVPQQQIQQQQVPQQQIQRQQAPQQQVQQLQVPQQQQLQIQLQQIKKQQIQQQPPQIQVMKTVPRVEQAPQTRPIVQQSINPVIVQHGAQGVQVIRQDEQNDKPTEKPQTKGQSSQTSQKTDNGAQGQTAQKQQAVVVVSHGPSGVHIIREGEQNPIPPSKISQIEENAISTQQRVTQSSNELIQSTPAPTQTIFHAEAVEIAPAQGHKVPQVQVSHESENGQSVRKTIASVSQNIGVQIHPGSSIGPVLTPVKQIPHISHFSFGVPTSSSISQDSQKTEKVSERSSDIQNLPPLLHKVAQNVVVGVPQVSQTIKEVSHGVQTIPDAIYQVSEGVQQLNQGIQQALQQANPSSEGVRLRDSGHPSILSSAEAYVNSLQRDKSPQFRPVEHAVEEVPQQEAALENRQLPFQDDVPHQKPFQTQGQRAQPSGQQARPQYGNRKPVQSAPVNQIHAITSDRVESPAVDEEAIDPTPVPIIRYENSVSPDGTYQWSYESGNGIKAKESGLLQNRGDPDKEAIAVQGGYSYTGPDGIFYSIEYIADQYGFQPLGRHLPTQPPMPEALQKAIDEHMAILATAEPDPEEEKEQPVQTDNILGAPQNKYNYSQRLS